MIRKPFILCVAVTALAVGLAWEAHAEEAAAPPTEETPPAPETTPAAEGEAEAEASPDAEPEATPVATPVAAPAPEPVPEPDPEPEPEPTPPEATPADPEPTAADDAQAARLAGYREQLAADDRPTPAGMGGIFVPAMTDATLEPAIDIYRGDELVQSSPIGRKVFVPPGSYRVRVGLGNDQVRPTTDVEVTAGEVALVEPVWGALVIDVVDNHNIPHRGAYDLIRLDTRETVGSGRGANRRTAEGLRTWLLIPGVYKIVPPGGTYRERANFVTVRVMPGEPIPFALVMDATSGDFQGGGIAPERAATTSGGLRVRSALGGSVELTHRYHVAGTDDGATVGATLFLDFDLLYDQDLNYLSVQLQMEAGLAFLGDDDWRKTLDFADIAAIYVLQLHRAIGPYISASYSTNLIPGYDYVEEGTIVERYDSDGELETSYSDDTRVSLGPSFSRNDIREGVGANFRAIRSRYLDLDLRLGFGFQQLVTDDLYTLDDDEDTEDTLEYTRIEDFTHREGAEFGLTAAGSLTGWLSYNIEFSLLEPFGDAKNPVIDFDLSLTLRLFAFASLNYVLRIRRDVVLSDDAQVDQALLLRFAFNLF